MIAALLVAAAIDSLFIANPVVTGHLERGLEEASGIVASKQHPGLFWVNNDSGDGPILYAIDSMGRRLCSYEISTDDVVKDGSDWEDLAYGWHVAGGDTTYYVYAADIGDNNARRDFVSIYRMREGSNMKCVRAEKLEPPRPFSASRRGFVYPDGARDAETLLFDPLTEDLYIVSKRELRNRLYRVPREVKEKDADDLGHVDTLEFLMELPLFASTGGDISTDGREILIKNYTHVYRWKRNPSESLESALQRTPEKLNYVPEPQGEAICFNASGAGFYTVSEAGHNGVSAAMYYYARTRDKPEKGLSIEKSKKRATEYTIKYTIPNLMPVALTVHNDLMMRVKTLVDDSQKAGAYSHKIDMSEAAPGTYVVVLQSGGAFYDAIPFTIESKPAPMKVPVATETRKRKKSSRK